MRIAVRVMRGGKVVCNIEGDLGGIRLRCGTEVGMVATFEATLGETTFVAGNPDAIIPHVPQSALAIG